MSGLDLGAAKQAASEAQTGNLRENNAGIPEDLRFDYEAEDAPMVDCNPEILVRFGHIAGLSVFNTGDDFLNQRQNLEGAGPQGYGNDVVLTLANPEIIEGVLWQYPEDDFTDYKIIGDPTDDYIPYETKENVLRDDDGNVTGAETVGIDLGMGDFEGEAVKVDEDEDLLDEDFIQVMVSSRRASRILGQLDTAGRWSHDTEGNFTEGIVEAPPKLGDDDYDSDEDGAPRAIGYAELREDMVDQEGALMYSWDTDEPTVQTRVDVDVLKIVDGELEGLAPLTPEDDHYAKPTYPRAGNLYWEHDEDGASEGDVNADAEPETGGGVAEAQAAMSDDGDNDETTYDDLTDDGQAFVDAAVDALDQLGSDSTDAFEDPDFAARVDAEKAESDVQASADELASITESRA